MTELQELYQQVILDHNKSPRNFGELPDAPAVEGHNPLCGDNVTVFVKVVDGVIEDVKFKGAGCAISKASASIMTTLVKGKTVLEARELFARFHELVTEDGDVDPLVLGKMAVFAGVRDYPSRVKCASLAWHTLKNALEDNTDTVVTTE